MRQTGSDVVSDRVEGLGRDTHVRGTWIHRLWSIDYLCSKERRHVLQAVAVVFSSDQLQDGELSTLRCGQVNTHAQPRGIGEAQAEAMTLTRHPWRTFNGWHEIQHVQLQETDLILDKDRNTFVSVSVWICGGINPTGVRQVSPWETTSAACDPDIMRRWKSRPPAHGRPAPPPGQTHFARHELLMESSRRSSSSWNFSSAPPPPACLQRVPQPHTHLRSFHPAAAALTFVSVCVGVHYLVHHGVAESVQWGPLLVKPGHSEHVHFDLSRRLMWLEFLFVLLRQGWWRCGPSPADSTSLCQWRWTEAVLLSALPAGGVREIVETLVSGKELKGLYSEVPAKNN